MLKIIDLLLIVLLLIIGEETIIKINKSEGKKVEDVRKPLLIRIDVIMTLIITIAIITIVNIFINR